MNNGTEIATLKARAEKAERERDEALSQTVALQLRVDDLTARMGPTPSTEMFDCTWCGQRHAETVQGLMFCRAAMSIRLENLENLGDRLRGERDEARKALADARREKASECCSCHKRPAVHRVVLSDPDPGGFADGIEVCSECLEKRRRGET